MKLIAYPNYKYGFHGWITYCPQCGKFVKVSDTDSVPDIMIIPCCGNVVEIVKPDVKDLFIFYRMLKKYCHRKFENEEA